MRRERTARLLNPIGTRWLARQVPDPALRAALTPNFTLGCKRLLLSNTYLPALTKGNVELIPHALAEVDGRVVVGADGTRREVDVIIFGTGFDVSHPPIASRIRGRDGTLLSEKWSKSPEAYLATTTPGAPNAYIMLGPNILVYNSFLGLAETQLDYVIDGLTKAERQGIEVLRYAIGRSAGSTTRYRRAWSRPSSTTADAVATTSTPTAGTSPRGRGPPVPCAVASPGSTSRTTPSARTGQRSPRPPPSGKSR